MAHGAIRCPFFFVTGDSDVGFAVAALKSGTFDVLVKQCVGGQFSISPLACNADLVATIRSGI